MIFDGVTTGSPVWANQINNLVFEIERILTECPSTSTFTYLGPIGTTTNYKTATEFQTSIVIPVPSVVSSCEATCHTLFCPIAYNSTLETMLDSATLSWLFLARATDGTVGTYSAVTYPSYWVPYATADWFGNQVCDAPVLMALGATNTSKYTGALVAVRLSGTWGYSGDIPGFCAFFTY